jgi:hypothetical protein
VKLEKLEKMKETMVMERLESNSKVKMRYQYEWSIYVQIEVNELEKKLTQIQCYELEQGQILGI